MLLKESRVFIIFVESINGKILKIMKKNYNKESYIKIVDDTDLWIKVHAPKFYKVAFEYCIQLRDEEQNRQAKFMIK